MPERPHPDLDRVREALGERDETVPEPPPDEPPADEPPPEDDGEA
jgi:hypothetical protein